MGDLRYRTARHSERDTDPDQGRRGQAAHDTPIPKLTVRTKRPRASRVPEQGELADIERRQDDEGTGAEQHRTT